MSFGSGEKVYAWSSTGVACSGSDPIAETEKLCDDASGICTDVDQTGNITDDGSSAQPMPTVAELQSQGCVTTESGAAFCIISSPTKPDNGVPGTEATPDKVVTLKPPANGQPRGGSSTTINYYSSSTVNNSTNMGSGDPDGDGSDSSGECSPGDSACEGGGRGDGRVSGPGGTTKTYGASAASLYAAIQGSPIGQAVNGISSGMPTGGTCPVISMNLPIIGAISSDMHCDLWAGTVAPLLQLVFLAIWALIAVRIVLEG